MMAEQAKYEQMWAHEVYRAVAPGEDVAPLFLAQARPAPGSTVIDFGAGTGRGALMLALLGGLRVRMLDFAENCLDADVRAALKTQSHALDFTQHDLTRPVPFTEKYGYCTDVMEHIPPEQVDRVLANILLAAQHVFFMISCEQDNCGKVIGETLHLSVHDHAWWLKKLYDFDAHVHWSRDFGNHCCFYVTAWRTGHQITKVGELNIEQQKIRENVVVNLKGPWIPVAPHSTNDIDFMILGGGPSLNGQLETIKQLRAEGVKLATLNGSYNWALEHGLTPSAQFVVDARPHNARFTRPVVDGCKYFIASQCDPAVFEGLPEDRTYLWHSSTEMIKDLLEHLPLWYGVPGGSTVLTRAICLLRMLGFKRFHLFGCDSCLEDGKHHAYAQPENDSEVVINTIVGDRVFHCHAWQCMQAQEFIDLITVFGDEIELEVHGDGLLRHILTAGAEFADSQQEMI